MDASAAVKRGRWVVVSLLGAALAMGAGLWYAQTQAWYTDAPVEIALTRFDGAVEPLLSSAVEGIDAETSPLRYRACFATELSLATLTETFIPYPDPVPLTAPGWFECFDAQALGRALEEGTALAFLGRRNAPYGFDIVVAIDEAGRGYAWRQMNPCGEASFSGDPLPPGCSERTESDG